MFVTLGGSVIGLCCLVFLIFGFVGMMVFMVILVLFWIGLGLILRLCVLMVLGIGFGAAIVLCLCFWVVVCGFKGHGLVCCCHCSVFVRLK